jgi:hypothetical protein
VNDAVSSLLVVSPERNTDLVEGQHCFSGAGTRGASASWRRPWSAGFIPQDRGPSPRDGPSQAPSNFRTSCGLKSAFRRGMERVHAASAQESRKVCPNAVSASIPALKGRRGLNQVRSTFTLTLSLSPRERGSRENASRTMSRLRSRHRRGTIQVERVNFLPTLDAVLPLPGGEGRGEGECASRFG